METPNASNPPGCHSAHSQVERSSRTLKCGRKCGLAARAKAQPVPIRIGNSYPPGVMSRLALRARGNQAAATATSSLLDIGQKSPEFSAIVTPAGATGGANVVMRLSYRIERLSSRRADCLAFKFGVALPIDIAWRSESVRPAFWVLTRKGGDDG